MNQVMSERYRVRQSVKNMKYTLSVRSSRFTLHLVTDSSTPYLLVVDILRSDYWNVKAKKLAYLSVNLKQFDYWENILDITQSLMDAGFNETVTIIISFIWEMLEIGAK